MKGLFQKDMQLIVSQKRFLLLYFILIGIFLFYNPAFGFIYLFLLASVFLVKTIAFDESDGGMLTIFSWPISRKDYVLEKYLLSLGIPLLMALILIAVHSLLSMTSLEQAFSYVFYGLLTAALLVSMAIPVELKFGAQRSGLVFGFLGAAMFVVIYFINQGLFLNSLSALSETWTMIQFLLIIALIMAAILAVSVFVSIAILKRKDF